MDYSLTRQRHSTPQYDLDTSLPYGDVPNTMLMRKFEETDVGDEEMAYDTFVRGEIKNWAPDTAIYEHERSRGGVNQRSGKLNLQYEGHRGSAQYERPEEFLGFGGPEDRDPRGTNVDPDMKELTRQKWARGRFQRFTSDGVDDQQITGGGVSEAGMMAIRQQVHRYTRANLKVFSRQLDGRREGMRRQWVHASDAAKQVRVQAYGDYIKDYALNPQRRATIISREIIRDSAAWRAETNDQDLAFAHYAQVRSARKTGPIDSTITNNVQTQELADSDMSKSFKAVGLLMSHLVREKQSHDGIDFSDGSTTQTRKVAPCAKDLAAILQGIVQSQQLGDSDATQHRKRGVDRAGTDAWQGSHVQHAMPAHHYLNAEIIYRNMSIGDMSLISREVVTDATVARAISEDAARKRFTWMAKARSVDVAEDNVDREQAEAAKYISYRTMKQVVGAWTPQNIDEVAMSESANSQNRRRQDRFKVMHVGDTVDDIKRGDNLYQNRHGAPVGSKYTMRQLVKEESKQSDFKGSS